MASKRTTLFPGRAYAEPGASPSPSLQQSTKIQARLSKNVNRQPTGPLLPIKASLPAQPNKKHSDDFSNQVQRKDPWDDYEQVIEEGQGGPAMIAYSKIPPKFEFVAVKSYKSSFKDGYRLRTFQHPCAVALRRIYFHCGEYFFMYEMQGLSLHDVLCTPGDPFAPFEVAAICEEVLKALTFVHYTLDVGYGRLEPSNIMMGRSGSIKLGTNMDQVFSIADEKANIGDCMIEEALHRPEDDVRALGPIVTRLLGPLHQYEGGSFNLQTIRSFLDQTETKDARTLQKVELSSPPHVSCC
jgi:hypothetical protein